MSRKPIILSDEINNQVLSLRKEGKGYRTIAEIINEHLPEGEKVSYQYVRRMIKR